MGTKHEHPYAAIAAALLDWYGRARRRLPWRAEPGTLAEPYAAWVAEAMLQQVRVAVVAPRYAPFLARFPDAAALASAPVEEVLRHWNGLGRYGRAHNLHAAARLVVERHGGALPSCPVALRALPGVGPYTAAAVRAVAFGLGDPPPVDPNVERVTARLFRVRAPLPGARPRLAAHAAALLRHGPAGDVMQALMDLGATVCRPPRAPPRCEACPVAGLCRSAGTSDAARLPVLPPKPPRAVRHAAAFRAVRVSDGAVLLRRRPARGVLAGTLDLPATGFTARPPRRAAALAEAAPFAAGWRRVPGEVRHAMSGFEARVAVYAVRVDGPAADGVWLDPGALDGEAVAGLARKLVAHGSR